MAKRFVYIIRFLRSTMMDLNPNSQIKPINPPSLRYGGQSHQPSTRLRFATAGKAINLFFYVLLLISLSAHAQDSPPIKTSIDKMHILIGEPVRLSIDVTFPIVDSFLPPQVDTIPHFEFLGKGSLDSLVSGNSVSYHLEWKLTSFDSGTWKIPAFPLVIGHGKYHSDSLLVDVSYGSLDSAKDYHDIKGIIDKENPAVKYLLWVVLGLTATDIFLFILFSTKPLPQEAAQEERKIAGLSPLDEAMAALDLLKKTPLNDPPSVKKYYSGMNDVLRVYLSRNMGLSAMERTNEELILQVSRLNLDKDSFSHLTSSLRMSDFVKFAKYLPDVYDNERNLQVIRDSIVLIHETRK